MAERLQDDRAWVPAVCALELTNVFRTTCLRQRQNAEQAQQVLALALRFGLSSYDASYLELALRQQLPLATKDADLAAAARVAGVGVVATSG